MRYNSDENTFEMGKIDMIKMVRRLGNYGLLEAKIMVELFMNAHRVDGITSVSTLMNFMTFIGLFTRGIYVLVDGGMRLNAPMEISDEEIRRLSTNDMC